MTPEGKVKAKISKVLAEFKSAYSYMPVPAGYGPSSLDYLVCVGGQFLAIEAKKPGGKTTPRQNMNIERIRRAGGTAMVIEGTPEQLAALREFMENAIRASRPR